MFDTLLQSIMGYTYCSGYDKVGASTTTRWVGCLLGFDTLVMVSGIYPLFIVWDGLVGYLLRQLCSVYQGCTHCLEYFGV